MVLLSIWTRCDGVTMELNIAADKVTIQVLVLFRYTETLISSRRNSFYSEKLPLQIVWNISRLLLNLNNRFVAQRTTTVDLVTICGGLFIRLDEIPIDIFYQICIHLSRDSNQWSFDLFIRTAIASSIWDRRPGNQSSRSFPRAWFIPHLAQSSLLNTFGSYALANICPFPSHKRWGSMKSKSELTFGASLLVCTRVFDVHWASQIDYIYLKGERRRRRVEGEY